MSGRTMDAVSTGVGADHNDRENHARTAVSVESVEKRYDGTKALDGVSTAVREGEIFALVGPNGAGKTTLVRAMTGTVRPDRGRVTVFGTDPADVPPERIGALPQSFSPQGRLTALEIVRYFAGLYEEARDPRSVLEDVGLDPARETYYEDLSGGEKRRAAVATTLVNDPELVFLDEPTTAIDPRGRRRLWEHLRSVAADGTTIVLTTHDMAEAERLATRVAFLAGGRLVKTGAPGDLVARYGGQSRLVLETSDAPDGLDEYESVRTNEGLVVTGIDPTDIGDVVRTALESGVDFDALSWREPSLEDAYLLLVGERGDGRRNA
ncbi:MAG: ABC transporter ATP-binding protein [Halanaeroarchaeum sp.]